MTDKAVDWSWVPKREWEWQEGTWICGVHTYEGQLVWWGRPSGPTGYMSEGASVQSFQDFLASGPPVSVPPEVVEELQTILLGSKAS
ncbi:MAG: hypothetical protein Fur0022_07410 [Anaerolineales bacterium]